MTVYNYHYVYKTVCSLNGYYYIGSRSTNTAPEIDDYLGSGDMLKMAIWKIGKENFTKEVLKTFDTRIEADAYESQLVTNDVIKDYKSYNVAIGGAKFRSKRINKSTGEKYIPTRRIL